MSAQQLDIFGDSAINLQNPLTNRRVGFVGKIKNRAALVKKVKELGASEKSKDGLTRDTQILVMGSDVKQEELNRLKCYEHDGWKPLKITEADLQDIFKGHYSGFDTPAVVKKQVSLDMSYYNWTPPVLSEEDSDEDSGVRCSSPLTYGDDNPIYGMEIYVPNRANTDMGVIRQLIGNFGGYANAEYFDDTNVVMLNEETLHLLEQGKKDNVIAHIEAQYNMSSQKMFNIQFTSEPDFISWVKKRMEKYPDESTITLLNKYLGEKGINKQRVMIDSQYQNFKTDELIENKETPFYRKHVAIIGYLDNFGSASDIQELAFLLWVHGAAVTSHVTPSTEIVINGIGSDEEDMNLIRQMKENDANIMVYYQEDFENMLSEYRLLDWYSGRTSVDDKEHSEKQYSKSPAFVAIDFEKLDNSQISICEVGLVVFENGKEIEKFHSYINPVTGLKRSGWAKSNLCHITDKMLLEAPSYDQLFPKLKEIIGDRILVSHSISADLNYIYNMEEYFKLPKLYTKWIDTQEIARFHNFEENLPGLYLELFGTLFLDHHNALNDARACGQIFECFCSRFDIRQFVHEEEYLPSGKKHGNNASSIRHTQYGTSNVTPEGLVINNDMIPDKTFFRDKTVVRSGMSESDKIRIKSLLEVLGAKCTSDLSGDTDVFIINKNAVGPRKKEKAIKFQQSNGMLVITDDYFWELVK